MVYEVGPYLHTYLSRWLQAIQLSRPARGVTTATPDILEHVEHWYVRGAFGLPPKGNIRIGSGVLELQEDLQGAASNPGRFWAKK